MTATLEPHAATNSVPDFEIVTTHFDETRADIAATGALADGGAVLLYEIIESHIRAGRRYLRLDLSRVTSINDAGAATLAESHDRLFGHRGTLILTGLSIPIRTELTARGLERRLLILSAAA